jgi:1,4-alpha-glucan branching enzyme
MSLKKQYLKSGDLCKVTFTLPSQIAKLVTTAYLVGDFNGWDSSATPMKKLKNQTFTVTLTLRRNEEYQFRYFLDGVRWENDWNADKYVPNRYGSENSVVIV